MHRSLALPDNRRTSTIVLVLVLALLASIGTAVAKPKKAKAAAGSSGSVTSQIVTPVKIPAVKPTLCVLDPDSVALKCDGVTLYGGGSLEDLALRIDYTLTSYSAVPDVYNVAGTTLPTTVNGKAVGSCAGDPGVLIAMTGANFHTAGVEATIKGPNGDVKPPGKPSENRTTSALIYAFCNDQS